MSALLDTACHFEHAGGKFRLVQRFVADGGTGPWTREFTLEKRYPQPSGAVAWVAVNPKCGALEAGYVELLEQALKRLMDTARDLALHMNVVQSDVDYAAPFAEHDALFEKPQPPKDDEV